MRTTLGIITMMMLISSIGCKKETNSQKFSEKIISVSLKKSDTLYKNSFGRRLVGFTVSPRRRARD